MSKSGQTLVAEDEKKILVELQKNANESIDAIAQRCKFSRQKVWRCIKRLEQDHVIWGYTAIIDEEKQNRKSFVVAIKKTTTPLDEKTVRLITSSYLQDLASKEGIVIENSFYTHGEYDWIITFTADDLRQAKKFSELLNTTYQGYIAKMDFMETLFWTRKQRIFNPEAKKLKELFF
jgi:DNA-binding Lrp family transcriptional regulator